MADDIEKEILGTWRIVECVSLAGTVEPTGIEGTEFTLDESGDVLWKVAEEAEPMPFFSCETFEVSLLDVPLLKLCGTFAGHVIEFRVEVSDDLMLLTYERCCMLQCQKVSVSSHRDEVPFSFLGALEEGYFSDLVIKANTGKEYKCHKTILNLMVPGIDLSKPSTPLSGLTEDSLQATLYYLYTECLPRGMSEKTAKACVKSLSKQQGFGKFVKLCETFLANTALKQQITTLVNDMHACCDRIIDLFSGKVSGDSLGFGVESLISNPTRLIYVTKQILREGAVASAKLLIVCDIFTRRKAELSREERHDIIKYAKSRLPVFINQLHKFLEVGGQHTNNLTASQRLDLATYLVPEVEPMCEVLTHLVTETRVVLEQVIQTGNASDKNEKPEKSKKVGGVLGSALKRALHMRELMKLKTFHAKLSADITRIMLKRERFSTMSQETKIQSASKFIEQLVDEVPIFLIRVEEVMAALDEKVTWNEWKYLFKLGTSKAAWGINKAQTNRSELSAVIQKLCDMVNLDHFNSSLVMLGLLETPGGEGTTAVKTSSQVWSPVKYAHLNSVQSLCIPPMARDSAIAKAALQLLRMEEKCDMVFEIIVMQETGDTVIDHTFGEPITRTERERDVDVHEIKAHCVIIASRCDWFRRALLSGMRESIDKKITIHDTNPDLFRLFLEYLYCERLETSDLSTDQLADLMSVSDRYEMDSLKLLCEHSLKHHLDENSALFLLSLADHLNARSLRGAAINYISENPDVTQRDDFDELPDHLKVEVEDNLTWHSPLETRIRHISGHSNTETPSISELSSSSEVDDLINQLEIGDMNGASSSSTSSDDVPYLEDSDRLEACLTTLRDIIGESVPRDELVRVVLAADYDTNRALNFFFS